jgi:hypothetical protein
LFCCNWKYERISKDTFFAKAGERQGQPLPVKRPVAFSGERPLESTQQFILGVYCFGTPLFEQLQESVFERNAVFLKCLLVL